MAKLCRARLTLPSADGRYVVHFECNRPATNAHDDVHWEHGRVRAADGTVSTYEVSWRNAVGGSSEVWREMPKRLRVRLPRRPRQVSVQDNGELPQL